MGKKLYVGNLPFTSTDESLNTLFAEFGTVDSAKIIMDRESGRSKGFAFVEMSSDEEASASIAKLDGIDLEGRKINVSEAKPQTDRPRGGSSSFGRNSGGGRTRSW